MSVSLYYNATCPDCVRQARLTARMDWLGRVALRTDESPLGEVPVGEIVVVETESGRAFTGVYATRKVCLQVPLLYLQRAGALPGLRAADPRPVRPRPAWTGNGDGCEI